MRRELACGSLVLLLCLLTWAAVAVRPSPPAAAASAPASAPALPLERAAGDDDDDGDPLRLGRRIDFAGYRDEKATLDDALFDLRRKYGLRFTVDRRAFDYEGLKDPEGVLIADPKPIPAFQDVSLRFVLRRLLEKIPVPSGAVLMERGDVVEITTWNFQAWEVWGVTAPSQLLPLVNMAARERPLDEVLRGLAKQAEYEVILDHRVNARALVTARFRNVPLDVAIALAADQAGLRHVLLSNVIYVTTPANAADMARRHARPAVRPQGLEWPADFPPMPLRRAGVGGM
jgi:hypothetical protein